MYKFVATCLLLMLVVGALQESLAQGFENSENEYQLRRLFQDDAGHEDDFDGVDVDDDDDDYNSSLLKRGRFTKVFFPQMKRPMPDGVSKPASGQDEFAKRGSFMKIMTLPQLRKKQTAEKRASRWGGFGGPIGKK